MTFVSGVRDFAVARNFADFGVDVTITPPEPGPVVMTKGIWRPSSDDDLPSGGDRRALEPRRIMSLRRSVAADIQRGARLEAPETIGGTIRVWKVDGYERLDTYTIVVKLERQKDPLSAQN